MDSIPGECEGLGLVVFSNIIYYLFHSFIINDVILTAFCIIFSTWSYKYYAHSFLVVHSVQYLKQNFTDCACWNSEFYCIKIHS